MSYSKQSKTVNYGEEVTVYALGDTRETSDAYIFRHYYCTGFYDATGTCLKSYTDENPQRSYTFRATPTLTCNQFGIIVIIDFQTKHTLVVNSRGVFYCFYFLSGSKGSHRKL